jgi:hypothetical protein
VKVKGRKQTEGCDAALLLLLLASLVVAVILYFVFRGGRASEADVRWRLDELEQEAAAVYREYGEAVRERWQRDGRDDSPPDDEKMADLGRFNKEKPK